MKRVLSLGSGRYLAGASIFLLIVALIAGAAGCSGMYSLTMAVVPDAGGTATDLTGVSPYEAGTIVTVKAEANEGYVFDQWEATAGTFASANSSETTFTMPAHSAIVTAIFVSPLITTWYDLNAVRDNLAGNYILMNDLDSTTAGYEKLASSTANQGKGWQPIGTDDSPFSGTFDGGGHSVRNLSIDRLDESEVGLFGGVEQSGIVMNICLTDAAVRGYDNVGALVGYNHGIIENSCSGGHVTGSEFVGALVGANNGTLSDSHSTGSTSGISLAGGLVGDNNGTVSDSYSTSSVTGGNFTGGLVGVNRYSGIGTISNCYSTGTVVGIDSTGGLAGLNYGSVNDCYSTGRVTGDGLAHKVGSLVGWNAGNVTNSHSTGKVAGYTWVGGLVGLNDGGTISKCYSTSDVSGLGQWAGGLAGENWGTVTDSYSTGSVSSSSYVGGLVGENGGTVNNSYSTGYTSGTFTVGGLVGLNNGGIVSNSFWDTETSGQATSDGGTGKTTAEMQDVATFLGWDIVEVAGSGTRNIAYIWNIVDGVTYPFLSWQS
jgi:hypothetical protein